MDWHGAWGPFSSKWLLEDSSTPIKTNQKHFFISSIMFVLEGAKSMRSWSFYLLFTISLIFSASFWGWHVSSHLILISPSRFPTNAFVTPCTYFILSTKPNKIIRLLTLFVLLKDDGQVDFSNMAFTKLSSNNLLLQKKYTSLS